MPAHSTPRAVGRTARRLYYQMAGWDPETGEPTAAKLAELDVEVPGPVGV